MPWAFSSRWATPPPRIPTTTSRTPTVRPTTSRASLPAPLLGCQRLVLVDGRLQGALPAGLRAVEPMPAAAGTDPRGLLRFAGIMGPLSSVFDLLTFALLLAVFHATPDEFRTTWFLESMATQILVVFVIRTNGPFWANPPHIALTATSLFAFAVAMVLPFLPAGAWLGFVAPGWDVIAAIAALALAYLAIAEFIKRIAIGGRATGRLPRA